MMLESLKESGLKVKKACSYLGLPASSYYDNRLAQPAGEHRRKPTPDENFLWKR